MIDIKSMNLAELTAYLTENGFEKFRAKQVLNWIKQDVSSFDDMTNVPQKLRDFLKENAYLACAQIERVQRSRIDDTVKYLFRLYDGEYVEGVLMSYHHGRTMCISSQVGCKMGCTFCATGKSGFSRSLTASEMIAQIRSAELDILIASACDLTDRAVHCFTGEHGDAALKLEPDPECEHKTTDSKIEQLLRIIAHGDIVDQKAGKICQIAVNKRQYRLNDDLNGLAFSPKQGNLYRDLDYAEYIQPAAEGEQIADQRYRIRHRRNRRGSQPCLGREGNAHRGDEESDQEQ